MRNPVLLLFIFLVSFSCKKKEERFESNELGSKLRLKNETPFEIGSALVKIGGSENSYGPLKPNELSQYKVFKDSTYPYIKLRINDKDIEIQIQPIEAPPATGSAGPRGPVKPLTCVITYSNVSNGFDLHFIN